MSLISPLLSPTITTNILLPLSGFSFPYSHGYTLVTELRRVRTSDNLHCTTDFFFPMFILVYAGTTQLRVSSSFALFGSCCIVFPFPFLSFSSSRLLCFFHLFWGQFYVFAWRCVQRGLVKWLMTRRAQNTHDTFAYIMYESC